VIQHHLYLITEVAHRSFFDLQEKRNKAAAVDPGGEPRQQRHQRQPTVPAGLEAAAVAADSTDNDNQSSSWVNSMSNHGSRSSSDDSEGEDQQSDAHQQQSLQDNSCSDAQPARIQLRKRQHAANNVDEGTAGSTGRKRWMTGSSRHCQPAAAAAEAEAEATTAAGAASKDGRSLPVVELPGGMLRVDGMVGAMRGDRNVQTSVTNIVTVLNRQQSHWHAN
jgi:hypothetical protein